MEDLKLVISPSPHVRDTDTTEGIMVAVLISLIPVLAAAVYFFGFSAIRLVLLGGATAVATEAVFQKLPEQTHHGLGRECAGYWRPFGTDRTAHAAKLDDYCRICRGHSHWQAGVWRIGSQYIQPCLGRSGVFDCILCWINDRLDRPV